MADNQWLSDIWEKKKKSERERAKGGKQTKKLTPEEMKITHSPPPRISRILVTILRETQKNNVSIPENRIYWKEQLQNRKESGN